MGWEGLLVVVLTFAVLILLVLEKASLDAIGIGLLVILVLVGEIFHLIDPSFNPAENLLGLQEALSFFGNSAVLTIAALYVIGEGLTRTGAVEFLARAVLKSSRGSERRMVLLVALTSSAGTEPDSPTASPTDWWGRTSNAALPATTVPPVTGSPTTAPALAGAVLK